MNKITNMNVKQTPSIGTSDLHKHSLSRCQIYLKWQSKFTDEVLRSQFPFSTFTTHSCAFGGHEVTCYETEPSSAN